MFIIGSERNSRHVANKLKVYRTQKTNRHDLRVALRTFREARA